MCSYCGCESEPAVDALMREHEELARLMHEITALAEPAPPLAGAKLAELASSFAEHARTEEDGLFARLTAEGEATEVVTRLLEDHVRLVTGLSAGDLLARPLEMNELFADLAEHAEREETDLFPYALQALSPTSWDEIDWRTLVARSGAATGQAKTA